MIENIISYCSWCHEKTTHVCTEHNLLTRNIYLCSGCGNYTVQCRYCDNMARSKSKDWKKQEREGTLKGFAAKWSNELCAEHDGSIASFSKLNQRLDDITHYENIFKREKWNLLKAGKITCYGIMPGTLVFGPAAFLAAPGIASALGSAGLLGAASTGTAITTLSGVALTNASLAVVGGGTMAGGIAIITAAGLGLGGVTGGVISNQYFGEIKGFKIVKLKDGQGSPVIFINGFLSQKKQNPQEWQEGVSEKYSANPQYLVEWESKALYHLGSITGQTGAKATFQKLAKNAAKRAMKNPKIGPIIGLSILTDLLSNPWHTALVKASKTGTLLADILSRTTDTQFILMGSSLGCRVIYYLLQALSTKKQHFVKDVWLLGGAVDKEDNTGWANAANAVSGRIHNCYSSQDNILKYLYIPSLAMQSQPVGLGEISCQNNKILNLDVSDLVSGHMDYKSNLAKILKRI